MSDELKKCCSCKERFTFENFHKNRRLKDGLANECKKCKIKNGIIRARRPENRAKLAKWRKANYERCKDYDLKSIFGLELGTYDKMLTAQNGTCAICKKLPTPRNRFDVDHDHLTNKVRGLLCKLCNKGLGHFKDSPELLEQAAAYLRTVTTK